MKVFKNLSRSAYIAFCCCIYLILLISTISIEVTVINNLISRNNIQQMETTASMAVDKMNSSFNMMIGYTKQLAIAISERSINSYEEEYKALKNTLDNDVSYVSIGIVDRLGKVYGDSGEKQDMKSNDLVKLAKRAPGLFISTPYRSANSGDNVISVFYPITQNDSYAGSLFITYTMDSVQELAANATLKGDYKVFLMDAISGNYIDCSVVSRVTYGQWNNIRVFKSEITDEKGYDLDEWLLAMRNGDIYNNIHCYKQGRKRYVQVFAPIAEMDNWYMVVQAPDNVYKDVMGRYFRSIVSVLVIVALLTIMLVLAIIYRFRSEQLQSKFLSETDQLTHLMNRRAFEQKLMEIENSDESRYGVFMFVDMDNFKNVNDTYGHAAGDEVIQKFVRCLESVFAPYGYLSRVGGDEFNVFIKDTRSKKWVNDSLKTLQFLLKGIELDDGTKVPMSCSVGMAVFGEDSRSFSDLKEYADLALYYVKEHGKAHGCWYTELEEKKAEEEAKNN